METIARPYARAIFQLAEKQDDIALWFSFLTTLSSSFKEKSFAKYLVNPTVSKETKISSLLDLLEGPVNTEQQNFVKLLLHNGRISFLPTIARLFEAMKLKKENTTVAQVYTAFPLEEADKTSLAAYLSKFSGKQVLLNVVEATNLKGGMVIEFDGMSLDYSIKGKLQKLTKIF